MGNQESSRRVSFENDVSRNEVKVSEDVVAELLKQSENSQRRGDFANRSKSHLQKPVLVSENPGPPGLRYLADDGVQEATEYWNDRIQFLEDSHKRIKERWDTEYKKALEDVDLLFGNNPQPKEMCAAEKKAVISCYKSNAGQTLSCNNEVKTFYDCVTSGGKKEEDKTKKK